MSQSELRKVVYQFIKCNLAGKVIKNEDTGINVQITVSAGRKTAYGEAMYLKKASVVQIIPQVIRYAKYNNFGAQKSTDAKNILGYLNYKCKCTMIDGKTECLRLAIRLQNDGKFYYNIEINKITS
ncbi:MAG: hypothetical protein ACI30H_02585 [Paludibacteraceae bacterium]